MPSSGGIPSCPLDLWTDRQHLSISFTSACPAIRSCHRWRYEHLNHCWQHFCRSDLLDKALLYMECQLCVCQAYQFFIELAQKSHLFQAVQVCWYWCLSRRELPCHVKGSTSWTLASTRVHSGRCKYCRVCTVLRQVHPSIWALNCPTLLPNNLPSQCNPRICPTTVGHVLPHHRTTLLTPWMMHIARPLFLHCWLIIVVNCTTCPTCPSNLVSSRKRLWLYSMANSHVMLSRSSNSVGLCTSSMLAILHQPFNLGICLFTFD